MLFTAPSQPTLVASDWLSLLDRFRLGPLTGTEPHLSCTAVEVMHTGVFTVLTWGKPTTRGWESPSVD